MYVSCLCDCMTFPSTPFVYMNVSCLFSCFATSLCLSVQRVLLLPTNAFQWFRPSPNNRLRSVSEISSCFFGPRPWHIEIRHRVKKTPTINLFGFETLKLKFRRLKLWKPTVHFSADLHFPVGGLPGGALEFLLGSYIYIYIYTHTYTHIHTFILPCGASSEPGARWATTSAPLQAARHLRFVVSISLSLYIYIYIYVERERERERERQR